MNDHDLPPLPADIERLIRDAPRPVPPPGFGPDLLGRIKGTIGGPPPVPPPPVSKMGSWGIPVSAATLVVGAAVGVFVGTQLSPPPLPPPRVVQAVAPRVVEPVPPPPVVVADPPAPKPNVRPPAPPIPPPPVKPTRDLDLSDERALVEMARSALARRQTPKAIAALEDHARRFPKGQLAEEREALLIQALVHAGQRDVARARAADFKARFPESMLWPAIEAALGP